MIRTSLAIFALVPCLVFFSGCSRDDPGGENGMLPDQVDAMPAVQPLDPPKITSWVEATPLPSVAVRGQTDGTRIVASGAASGTVIAQVLPGGSFCIDCTLFSGDTTTLTFFAVGDGQVSDPVTIETTRDPGAAQPSDPTCSGAAPTECTDVEVCDSAGDDDCNGLVDACDPHCNSCIDDGYEPNDAPRLVPTLVSGTYEGLIICPCRDDWFAFNLDAGEQLHVFADFRQSQVDIDLHLFTAGEAGVGTVEPLESPLARAASTDDDEDLVFTPEAAGTYFLRVFSFPDSEGAGNYSLTVD